MEMSLDGLSNFYFYGEEGKKTYFYKLGRPSTARISLYNPHYYSYEDPILYFFILCRIHTQDIDF